MQLVEALSGIDSQDESQLSTYNLGNTHLGDLQQQVVQLTDLSRNMMCSLEAQQLVLDHQSHRINRLLRQQHRLLKHHHVTNREHRKSRQRSVNKSDSEVSQHSLDNSNLGPPYGGSMASIDEH